MRPNKALDCSVAASRQRLAPLLARCSGVDVDTLLQRASEELMLLWPATPAVKGPGAHEELAWCLADPLGWRAGAGLDPCAALATRLRVPVGATVEPLFLLGYAATADAARHLATEAAGVPAAKRLQRAQAQWNDLLQSTQVQTLALSWAQPARRRAQIITWVRRPTPKGGST